MTEIFLPILNVENDCAERDSILLGVFLSDEKAQKALDEVLKQITNIPEGTTFDSWIATYQLDELRFVIEDLDYWLEN